MDTEKKPFTTRGFVSLVVTFSFLVLMMSGIALYIAPTCRVARDSGWSFICISKETWESLHVVFAFVFILSTVFHFIYNSKLFFRYIVEKINGRNVLKTEAVAALIIIAALWVMSSFKIPPVGWIVDLHDAVKYSWDSDRRDGTEFQRGRGFNRGRGEGRRWR
jgi:hypothetical protein